MDHDQHQDGPDPDAGHRWEWDDRAYVPPPRDWTRPEDEPDPDDPERRRWRTIDRIPFGLGG